MNYDKDIRIDESALDIEWLDQPSLLMKYSRNAAQLDLDCKRKKVELSLIEAELDSKIRENPSRYKLEKVTEGAIKAIIQKDKGYQECQEELFTMEYEVNVANKAILAFTQRKEALENLVRLHGQQYFAGPRVPRDLASLREAQQKKTNNTVASSMQRNRKHD